MEEDKKESTYCDRGIYINIHSRADCNRYSFQLKELVEIVKIQDPYVCEMSL